MGEHIDIAAYCFPTWHIDPRNERWHGKGWTEWELLRAAGPRYAGHRQPIVPAWGCYDESDPAWAAKEIDLAADHGVTAFLYDWYWYEDGPFLNGALERGFLGAANTSRLKFALMWANHDWLDIHPAKFAGPAAKLIGGDIGRPTFEAMCEHVVTKLFTRPNYWKIDGEPLFQIYELGTFIRGMGGVEQAKAALGWLEERVRQAGFPGIHLSAMVWGFAVLPSEVKLADPAAVVRELGFKSVDSYTWVHHHNPNSAGFPRGSYAKAAEDNYRVWEANRGRFGVPYFPNVSMGWDPSPRTVQTDGYDARGYPFTSVLEGNTPAAFREALVRARQYVRGLPSAHKRVTLYAWNEWTEGSYLLPDTVHGMAYLEAVREVFGVRS